MVITRLINSPQNEDKFQSILSKQWTEKNNAKMNISLIIIITSINFFVLFCVCNNEVSQSEYYQNWSRLLSLWQEIICHLVIFHQNANWGNWHLKLKILIWRIWNSLLWNWVKLNFSIISRVDLNIYVKVENKL